LFFILTKKRKKEFELVFFSKFKWGARFSQLHFVTRYLFSSCVNFKKPTTPFFEKNPFSIL
jgi:hypothetical protein